MRALNFPADRLKVMCNGVDLERFQLLDRTVMRRELGLPADAPLLLTVGNLHEHKGQRLALETLTRLRATAGLADARLLVVGTGPDAGWLRQRAQALNLADAVQLVGPVPHHQLSRWYSAADILVLASSREGWPNVLLEAMACGTPVVASAVGGVAEIVQADEAGRVVAQRSVDGFSTAVLDLWSRRPCRAQVRRYAERFSWDATTRHQLDLFRTLIYGQPGPEPCAM